MGMARVAGARARSAHATNGAPTNGALTTLDYRPDWQVVYGLMKPDRTVSPELAAQIVRLHERGVAYDRIRSTLSTPRKRITRTLARAVVRAYRAYKKGETE